MGSDCTYCGAIPFVGDVLGTGSGANGRGLFNRVVAGRDDWVLVPTVGAFVEGYWLVVSRRHVYSFGELGRSTLARIEAEVCDLVVDGDGVFEVGLGELFGEYFVFEHGSGGPERPGGSCVRHAHLHLIPRRVVGLGLLDLLPFEALGRRRMSALAGYSGANYAWLMDPIARMSWVFGEGSDGRYPGCPSLRNGRLIGQWVRREVAASLGIDEWDWAIADGRDNVTAQLRAVEKARFVPTRVG